MPKIKTSRVKYPEGWELIEPTLRELEQKMREGVRSCRCGPLPFCLGWFDFSFCPSRMHVTAFLIPPRVRSSK